MQKLIKITSIWAWKRQKPPEIIKGEIEDLKEFQAFKVEIFFNHKVYSITFSINKELRDLIIDRKINLIKEIEKIILKVLEDERSKDKV